MNKKLAALLQTLIILLGLTVLTFMLWQPHLEGRNINASTFEIYFKDPFLAYAYIASIAFFVGLFNAFKALGHVRENNTFSEATVKALRNIKYSALTLSAFIVGAAVYIRIFHAKEDDPAGFLALSIVATFTSLVIAATAGTFQKTLQNAVRRKPENDLTV